MQGKIPQLGMLARRMEKVEDAIAANLQAEVDRIGLNPSLTIILTGQSLPQLFSI